MTEMGLFSPKRDPEDPDQLQIAVHELGHAWVWKEVGVKITEIRHTGDDGWVKTDWKKQGWTDELASRWAIGCWGGFEAEDRWFAQLGTGRAHRGNSVHDIAQFKRVTRGLKPAVPEKQARTRARALVGKHWTQILRQAPVLIRDGRISL